MDAFIRRKRRKTTLLRGAAAAVVVLAAGAGTWLQLRPAEVAEPAASQTIAPGNTKAILILADGTKIDIDGDSPVQTLPPGQKEFFHDEGTITVREPISPAAEDIYNTIIIPRGAEHSLLFADGTKVWLNAETTLRFPVSFGLSQRRVVLSGEAYFSVATDPARPLVVETDLGEVEVLGTEFNVRRYPGTGGIRTTLVSGSVEFTNDRHESVSIPPGFQASYWEGGAGTEVRPVKVADEVSWRYHKLSFENRTLGEIMESLARWYDFEVTFESERVEGLLFTGSIDRHEQFSSITEIFEASVPIRFEIEGRKVMIREKI